MGLFGKSKKDIQIEEMQKQIQILQAQVKYYQEHLTPDQQEERRLTLSIAELNERKKEIESDIQKKADELEKKRTQLSEQKSYIQQQKNQISDLKKQIYDLNEDIDMQEYGLYKPTYEFANSDKYKDELKKTRQMQKDLIKEKKACTGASSWTVNGNASQGRKMVADMQKLLLRAFNSECDDIVAHVRISNSTKSQERIKSICESISKLGKIMGISITPLYMSLKMRELYLALDFAQKKAEEKEQLRELREQEREEKRIQKEIEEARKKLEKEKSHYQNALQLLESQLEKNPDDADLLEKKSKLEADIADTQKAISDVDYREANKRAGYVYVISNIGAFGEDVYKIGMTRRLDPMDRVNELGDASVPFCFDVHALIFSEDAPALETALHNAFEDKKVNKINQRREFFHVTLDEIKEVVHKNFDKTVEWTDVPEAEQYRQSLVMGKTEVVNVG